MSDAAARPETLGSFLSRRVRRGRALLVSVLTVAALTSTPALAQDWPRGPISLVVPYTAGGNTDIMARLFAESLSKELGQSVIVDNRGGAGGAIATEYVARANNDGYTLLFGTNAQMSVVPLVQKVRYDPKTAFTPISIYGMNPYILTVNSRLPVNTVAELIAYGKSHPNELNYGSGGVGAITHLGTAIFGKKAGIELQHVPFKGGSQTVTALMSGTIQLYLGNTSEILPMVGAKDLKLLAVSSLDRLSDLPNLPTIAETLPGYAVAAWNGVLAPAGTPKPVVDRLEAAAIKAAKDPEVAAKLRKLGIVAQGSTAAELQKLMESEAQFYRDAVDVAGIRVQ